MMKIRESFQHFEEKTASFLQNYLVFFLFGIVYFYLYFILFVKLHFPYDTNHIPRWYEINGVDKYLPPFLCIPLFYLLIKKENINHAYASTLFYFGHLLSAVYCWKISTVFLPLGTASRAYGEYWWRIVPFLSESYMLSLHHILYEIENIPIIGTMINLLIGIGVCFLVAFLLCKYQNLLFKLFRFKQADNPNDNPIFVSFFPVILPLSTYFIVASLDWGGSVETVKAYHDICKENTGYLRKQKIKQ